MGRSQVLFNRRKGRGRGARGGRSETNAPKRVPITHGRNPPTASQHDQQQYSYKDTNDDNEENEPMIRSTRSPQSHDIQRNTVNAEEDYSDFHLLDATVSSQRYILTGRKDSADDYQPVTQLSLLSSSPGEFEVQLANAFRILEPSLLYRIPSHHADYLAHRNLYQYVSDEARSASLLSSLSSITGDKEINRSFRDVPCQPDPERAVSSTPHTVTGHNKANPIYARVVDTTHTTILSVREGIIDSSVAPTAEGNVGSKMSITTLSSQSNTALATTGIDHQSSSMNSKFDGSHPSDRIATTREGHPIKAAPIPPSMRPPTSTAKVTTTLGIPPSAIPSSDPVLISRTIRTEPTVGTSLESVSAPNMTPATSVTHTATSLLEVDLVFHPTVSDDNDDEGEEEDLITRNPRYDTQPMDGLQQYNVHTSMNSNGAVSTTKYVGLPVMQGEDGMQSTSSSTGAVVVMPTAPTSSAARQSVSNHQAAVHAARDHGGNNEEEEEEENDGGDDDGDMDQWLDRALQTFGSSSGSAVGEEETLTIVRPPIPQQQQQPPPPTWQKQRLVEQEQDETGDDNLEEWLDSVI